VEALKRVAAGQSWKRYGAFVAFLDIAMAYRPVAGLVAGSSVMRGLSARFGLRVCWGALDLDASNFNPFRSSAPPRADRWTDAPKREEDNHPGLAASGSETESQT